MSEKWGNASIPTIARWELDTVRIPEKKLLSLVVFFQENGLIVSEEWIRDGKCAPPIFLQQNIFDQLDFDSIAQEKLLDINRQTNNFIFGQVKNNLMSPFLKYGDYIGGVNLNKESSLTSLEGELVFLKIKIKEIIVGFFKSKIEEEIYICNFEATTTLININQIEAIGKIQWIARRP
ncbi:MAG: hypothetical protein H2069_10195 [Legionella sp.]|nr:hypothetical protein [Legionella sp.]